MERGIKDIVIIGSGGFSKQVIEIIEKINLIKKKYNLIGLIDDDKKRIGSNVLGYQVIGDTDFIKQHAKKNKIYGVIAIADAKTRRKIAEKLNKILWENLIHPSATVSNYTKIGEGNIISAGVVINPNLEMGNHCHINIGSTLGHDVTLDDFVTIMPGSRISGNVKLKTKCMVGTGAIIKQGLVIEENVVLGAGAVLIDNTLPNYIYVGVPAKRNRKK